MTQRHVDALVLGGGLAGRIAALLLARHGLRTQLLAEPAAPGADWPVSSVLVERFLDQFGGRSCLTPPAPFQILTPRTRITIHGPTDLEAELRRELPRSGEQVLTLLRGLEELGRRLEETLAESEAVPVPGFDRRLRFFRQAVRRRLPRRELQRPLTTLLAALADAEARETMAQLFSGLALLPVEQLSTADAALLWSAASRPRRISASGFDTLLQNRLVQFHGQCDVLQNLREIVRAGQRPSAVQLKNGHLCTPRLWVAERALIDGDRSAAPNSDPTWRVRFQLRSSRPSEMLASQVILGGNPPLRLTLENGRHTGVVACSQALPEGVLRERLAELFPFCEIAFEPFPALPAPGVPAIVRPRGLLGLRGRPVLARTVLNASRPELLPALGFLGDVLWGHALAWEALRRLKR